MPAWRRVDPSESGGTGLIAAITAVLLVGAFLVLWRVGAFGSGPRAWSLDPAARASAMANEPLGAPYDALKSRFVVKKPPRPGDWLAEHTEKGQTLEEYRASSPRRPEAARRTIYLQRIGAFGARENEVIRATVAYLSLFYALPVKLAEDLPESVVPAEARRIHRTQLVEQIHTKYVLEKVLPPRMPADALVYIAFTTTDLYPADGWNFVFGQASRSAGVGVWSLARLDAPIKDDETFHVLLGRTLKIASHEVGHMIGMSHCVAYECTMNGNNHLEELDRTPFELCPVCLAKLCWNVGCDVDARARALVDFARTWKLPGGL